MPLLELERRFGFKKGQSKQGFLLLGKWWSPNETIVSITPDKPGNVVIEVESVDQ
jgi:hypothetical protein